MWSVVTWKILTHVFILHDRTILCDHIQILYQVWIYHAVKPFGKIIVHKEKAAIRVGGGTITHSPKL